KNISIPFMVHAGSTHAYCGVELSNLGTGANTGYMERVRIFVHDVTLIDEDGTNYPVSLENNDWQTENVTLLSFADKENCVENTEDTIETNMEVLGKIEAPKNAVITGLSFKVGVPFELNHQNPTTLEEPLKSADS